MQDPALIRVERREHVVLDRDLGAFGDAQGLAAGRRDLDEMAPTVAGIAQASAVAELLELVQEQDDVVGVHAEGVGEILLGAAVVV